MDRKKQIFVFLIAVVFLLSYFRVPLLFFQQDELLGLGQFMNEGNKVILSGLGSAGIRHFVPITMSISFFIFKYFGLSYYIYNIVGLFFHLLNGILVYFLAKTLFKKSLSALIAVLIFFSSSVAAQLVMWPVINLNTISLTFSLLAWLSIVKKKLFWVPVLFLLSVFSLEYSAGLILFVPLAVFLTHGGTLRQKILKLIPFGLVAITYVIFRFAPILFGDRGLVAIGGGPSHFFPVEIFNLITRYFGQVLFGQDILLLFSKVFQKLFGLSHLGTAFAETDIFPLFGSFVGLLIIIFSVLIHRKIRRDKIYSNGFLLAFLFILFSALPFLLVPGGLSSVISSRYLYFGLAGGAILLTFFSEILGSYLVYVFLAILVVTGTIGNFRRSNMLYDQGKTRLYVLNTIRAKFVKFPEKVVFYIKSDRSYYGLPDDQKIPPFQSGFGQTLLLFYNSTENFPKDFFPGFYLWEITSQGYEEHGGRGLGYYRDLGLLKKDLIKYKIPVSSVIAFSWSGKTNSLMDITGEVIKEIEKQ